MVRSTDLVVEKIGFVVDTAVASGASSNELYDGVMFQGMTLMGRTWQQSHGPAQLGRSCPQRNERAVEVCSLLEDITRRYCRFSKRRATLRAAMESAFESHVREALPFELGHDASDFVDRLAAKCAEFAGDELVKRVVELLVELESLDVLPRLSHPVAENEGGSADDGDSGSQLSDLSSNESDVNSELFSDEEEEEDEECDEGAESDSEAESEAEAEAEARTHAPQARCEESSLPIRKRERAPHGSEESEDDVDEAMRLSRACKRAR